MTRAPTRDGRLDPFRGWTKPTKFDPKFPTTICRERAAGPRATNGGARAWVLYRPNEGFFGTIRWANGITRGSNGRFLRHATVEAAQASAERDLAAAVSEALLGESSEEGVEHR